MKSYRSELRFKTKHRREFINITPQIEECLRDGAPAGSIDFSARKESIKRHLSYIAKYKECPPTTKMAFMRKTIVWYTRGFPGARQLRAHIFDIKGYDELLEFVEELHNRKASAWGGAWAKRADAGA